MKCLIFVILALYKYTHIRCINFAIYSYSSFSLIWTFSYCHSFCLYFSESKTRRISLSISKFEFSLRPPLHITIIYWSRPLCKKAVALPLRSCQCWMPPWSYHFRLIVWVCVCALSRVKRLLLSWAASPIMMRCTLCCWCSDTMSSYVAPHTFSDQMNTEFMTIRDDAKKAEEQLGALYEFDGYLTLNLSCRDGLFCRAISITALPASAAFSKRLASIQICSPISYTTVVWYSHR